MIKCLQDYYVFISFLRNFDSEPFITVIYVLCLSNIFFLGDVNSFDTKSQNLTHFIPFNSMMLRTIICGIFMTR